MNSFVSMLVLLVVALIGKAIEAVVNWIEGIIYRAEREGIFA